MRVACRGARRRARVWAVGKGGGGDLCSGSKEGALLRPPRNLSRARSISGCEAASPCARFPPASPWAHLYVAAARALHRKRSASVRVSSRRAAARRKERTPSPPKHEARSSWGSGAVAVSRDALDVARGSPARDALVCTRSLASSARETLHADRAPSDVRNGDRPRLRPPLPVV